MGSGLPAPQLKLGTAPRRPDRQRVVNRRFEITDDESEQLAPLLASIRPRPGRPLAGHRHLRNGIVVGMRRGCPARTCPSARGHGRRSPGGSRAGRPMNLGQDRGRWWTQPVAAGELDASRPAAGRPVGTATMPRGRERVQLDLLAQPGGEPLKPRAVSSRRRLKRRATRVWRVGRSSHLALIGAAVQPVGVSPLPDDPAPRPADRRQAGVAWQDLTPATADAGPDHDGALAGRGAVTSQRVPDPPASSGAGTQPPGPSPPCAPELSPASTRSDVLS
jgi:hypothetical protein